MKIEALTIAVNFSDILAHTLPINKNLFDRFIVVTDTKDIKTKELCDFYHVQCIQTDKFYENSSIINKAKGINEGLKHLSKDAWIIHLDADIVLPPKFKSIIQNIEQELDTKSLYGMDRLMFHSYLEWQKFIENPILQHTGWAYVNSKPFEVGSRLALYTQKNTGYLPIGFFQMWHKDSGIFTYPQEHGDIDRSDVLFAKQWNRKNRILLPEILAYHLDSEIAELGKNWKGRKTQLFNLETFLLNFKHGYHCNIQCRIRKFLCKVFHICSQ